MPPFGVGSNRMIPRLVHLDFLVVNQWPVDVVHAHRAKVSAADNPESQPVSFAWSRDVRDVLESLRRVPNGLDQLILPRVGFLRSDVAEMGVVALGECFAPPSWIA